MLLLFTECPSIYQYPYYSTIFGQISVKHSENIKVIPVKTLKYIQPSLFVVFLFPYLKLLFMPVKR